MSYLLRCSGVGLVGALALLFLVIAVKRLLDDMRRLGGTSGGIADSSAPMEAQVAFWRRHGWVHPALAALAALALLAGALGTGAFQVLLAGGGPHQGALAWADPTRTPLMYGLWTATLTLVASLGLRIAQLKVLEKMAQRPADQTTRPTPPVELTAASVAALAEQVNQTAATRLAEISYELGANARALGELRDAVHARGATGAGRWLDESSPATSAPPAVPQPHLDALTRAVERNSAALDAAAWEMRAARDTLNGVTESTNAQFYALQERARSIEGQLQAERARVQAIEGERYSLEATVRSLQEDRDAARSKARDEILHEVNEHVVPRLRELVQRLRAQRQDEPEIPAELRETLLEEFEDMATVAVGSPNVAQKVAALRSWLQRDPAGPLGRAESAIEAQDVAAALASLVEHLDGGGRPVRLADVEADLWGITLQSWDEPDTFSRLRVGIEASLLAMGLSLVVPAVGESYHVSRHFPAVQGRGSSTLARNRVLSVIRPGLARGDEVIEKAHVELS